MWQIRAEDASLLHQYDTFERCLRQAASMVERTDLLNHVAVLEIWDCTRKHRPRVVCVLNSNGVENAGPYTGIGVLPLVDPLDLLASHR